MTSYEQLENLIEQLKSKIQDRDVPGIIQVYEASQDFDFDALWEEGVNSTAPEKYQSQIEEYDALIDQGNDIVYEAA